MMLLKCCAQYVRKFGKLSSGHRTGKGQFSFQSQRKAMPKSAQTTVQFQSSPTLCDPIDGSPPGSSVPGILQARIVEWVAISFSILGTTAAAAAAAKSLQLCQTLCDPRDGSPPGSPVPGILQARTLEWIAISFSNAGK